MKQMAITKPVIRRLFNKLHEPGGYAYENLSMQGTRPQLSTDRGDDAQSRCEIGPHLVKVEEHQPEMPVDEFVGVVKTVLQGLEDDCPPFFIQRCKINCLMQTSNVLPLDLLATRVANVGGTRIGPFGRFPSFFGVRFRFGPWDPSDLDDDDQDEEEDEEETEESIEIAAPTPPEQLGEPGAEIAAGEEAAAANEESDPGELKGFDGLEAHMGMLAEPQDGFYTVRFEPFSEDPSQIWIEVSSEYFAKTGPFTVDQFDQIGKNIKDTCEFAIQRCKVFLEQFDHPEEEGQ